MSNILIGHQVKTAFYNFVNANAENLFFTEEIELSF